MSFFDILQLIHEDDVTESLYLATIRPVQGIFNVAGCYTEPLSEVIRRLKHFPLPLPEFLIARSYKHLYELNQTHSFPFDVDFLKYSFAVDTTRARTVLGFEPQLL